MTASMIAVWQGPFPDPEPATPETVPYAKHLKVSAGASMIVLATTASQMASADPSWWTFH
jgi:hypothetical protein